ncbi:MAG TPA: enoyl-CoA hydratase [Novosphingobium sp.]
MTGPAGDLVMVERDAGIALVTLNRPEAMNAISRALRHRLCAVLAELDADPAIAVIILTGAGERAFSAGLDLKEMGSQAERPDPQLDNPVRALEACRKPVIGAINGVAVTGGFELALACDILLASTRARFADTHSRVGLLPGWGLSQRLSRTIGLYRARELSFSGNFIDAATAERWGLVNRVVAPDALLPAARALAADIASADPACVMAHKQLINDGAALPLGEALAFERAFSAERNRSQRGADIAARREAVQARGRGQQGSQQETAA